MQTMTRTALARLRRPSGDDGAAAVEFALVSLLLFTLLLGIMEFSLVMRDSVAITSAVRTGARIASAEAAAGHVTSCPPATTCAPANVPQLAQDAADAVQKAGSAMPKGNIDELWIYKAGTNGLPSGASSMSTATCGSDCVKFVWVDSAGKFQYASGTWTSTTIAACVGAGKSDSVGVIMKATHKMLFGLFGTSLSMSDRAVMQFEPLPNAICSAAGPTNGGHQ